MDILRLIALAELLILPGGIVAIAGSVLAAYWLYHDWHALRHPRQPDGQPMPPDPLDRVLIKSAWHHFSMELLRLSKILIVVLSALLTFFLMDLLDINERRLVIRIAFNILIWLIIWGSLKTVHYWKEVRDDALKAAIEGEVWDKKTERRRHARRGIPLNTDGEDAARSEEGVSEG